MCSGLMKQQLNSYVIKVGLEKEKKKKKSEAFDNSIIVRAQGNLSYNGSPKCLFQIYTVQSQWNF